MPRRRATAPPDAPLAIEPPGREIGIILDSSAPWEAWSAALCVLAWPDRVANVEWMAQTQLCFGCAMLRGRAAVEPEWARQPLTIRPAYLLLPPGGVDRRTGQTQRRLYQALQVARIVRPFFQADVQEMEPRLPNAIQRLSLNQIVGYVLEAQPSIDSHNFEAREFRCMRPVLHIAMRLEQVLGKVTEALGGQPPSLSQLAWDLPPVQTLLQAAEFHRPLVQRIHRFTVRGRDQVRLVAVVPQQV
jgi:hypothetical protein